MILWTVLNNDVQIRYSNNHVKSLSCKVIIFGVQTKYICLNQTNGTVDLTKFCLR